MICTASILAAFHRWDSRRDDVLSTMSRPAVFSCSFYLERTSKAPAITNTLLILGRPMASRTRIALFSLDASILVFLSASPALGPMSVAFCLSQQPVWYRNDAHVCVQRMAGYQVGSLSDIHLLSSLASITQHELDYAHRYSSTQFNIASLTNMCYESNRFVISDPPASDRTTC
jgi:hypothetical protein